MQYCKIKRVFPTLFSIFLLGMILFYAISFIQVNCEENFTGLFCSIIAFPLYRVFLWCRSLYYIEVSGTLYLISRKKLFHPDVNKASQKAVRDQIRYDSASLDLLNAVDVLSCMEGIEGDLERFKKQRVFFDRYILKSLELKFCLCGLCIYRATMADASTRCIFSIGRIPGKKVNTL